MTTFINFRPIHAKPPACPNLRRNRWAVAGVVVFNAVVWTLIAVGIAAVLEP